MIAKAFLFCVQSWIWNFNAGFWVQKQKADAFCLVVVWNICRDESILGFTFVLFWSNNFILSLTFLHKWLHQMIGVHLIAGTGGMERLCFCSQCELVQEEGGCWGNVLEHILLGTVFKTEQTCVLKHTWGTFEMHSKTFFCMIPKKWRNSQFCMPLWKLWILRDGSGFKLVFGVYAEI